MVAKFGTGMQDGSQMKGHGGNVLLGALEMHNGLLGKGRDPSRGTNPGTLHRNLTIPFYLITLTFYFTITPFPRANQTERS